MATRQEIHEISRAVDFTGKFRQAESGSWIAYCEEIPKARTQGKTKEEARENLKGAIAFTLEDSSPRELERFRVELTTEKERAQLFERTG